MSESQKPEELYFTRNQLLARTFAIACTLACSCLGETGEQLRVTNVAFAYKNFTTNWHASHTGLGVTALNTAKVLRRDGIKANVWPISSAAGLREKLIDNPAKHVVIAAPWMPSADLSALAAEFEDTHFAVNCHSNVGFLQADSHGVQLMREIMELETGTHNIHLAGNSERFCNWVRSAFRAPCVYLPNLYYLEGPPHWPCRPFSGGTLRVGIFGATRPLKNLMSAAAAALELARNIHAPLELWLSDGYAEAGGESVLAAVKEMLHGLPNVHLVLNGWQSWPVFRKTVAHMHLLLQPSYTESFNMVTADGVAEGVASVVSDAIDWAPQDWKAHVDDALDISRVGRRLLVDPRAPEDGFRALENYIAAGIQSYKRYVTIR
jgi:hypothetical protein